MARIGGSKACLLDDRRAMWSLIVDRRRVYPIGFHFLNVAVHASTMSWMSWTNCLADDQLPITRLPELSEAL